MMLVKGMFEEPFEPMEGILHHHEGIDLMPGNIELSAVEVALGSVDEQGNDYALCICIQQQNLLAFRRQTDPQIESRRRFAHAAFLIGEGDDFGHPTFLPSCKKADCIRKSKQSAFL
jgi:hypothetical protein